MVTFKNKALAILGLMAAIGWLHNMINLQILTLSDMTRSGAATAPLQAYTRYAPTYPPPIYYNLSAIPRPPDDLPKVGVCLFVKDSEAYIQEWLDYNIAIGVTEVYVLDNSKYFELKEWSKSMFPYVHKAIHRPKKMDQLQSYAMCVEQFRHRVDYLAFFDDDEFLVLHHPNLSWVGELARDYINARGAIQLKWNMFGTSDHKLYKPLPVLKRFVYAVYNDTQFTATKPIFHTKDYSSIINPHRVNLKHNTTTTHMDKSVAVLNHYKYKSIKEYTWKSCQRQSTNNKPKGCGDDMPSGTVFDDTAWQVLKTRVPWYSMFDSVVDGM